MVQAARMVTMSVRKDQVIHLAQVDAHQPRVADEKVGCSRIEQYLAVPYLNKQGKPVLSLQSLAVNNVLDEGRYLDVSVHACHSTMVTQPCTSGSSPY